MINPFMVGNLLDSSNAFYIAYSCEILFVSSFAKFIGGRVTPHE